MSEVHVNVSYFDFAIARRSNGQTFVSQLPTISLPRVGRESEPKNEGRVKLIMKYFPIFGTAVLGKTNRFH